MGEQDHIQSIGSIDTAGRSKGDTAGRSKGAHPQPAKKSHGDIVVDAISGPTRVLIAAVITVNLSLGAWLIERADFSRVKPQGSDVEAPLERHPADLHLPLHLPLAEASAAGGPRAAKVAHTSPDEYHEIGRREISRGPDPK